VDAFCELRVGTTADWRAAGLSAKRLHSLTGSGELVKLRHGVYARRAVVAEAESDPARRHALDVAAVRLARSQQAVASHLSAAVVWGLDLLTRPPDGTVSVTVPPGTRLGAFVSKGVITHAAELAPADVTTRYGVPLTTAARTVVDVARISPFMEGVVVADSAIHQLLTSKSDLGRALASQDRWPGSDRARKVVEFASGRAESVLESCARVVFREFRLPPPELQVVLNGANGRFIGRVDFFWPDHRVVAESDGLLKYSGAREAIAELRRDRLLREAGFEVVHVTWAELFSQPERVVERIRDTFERAARLRR
jgi:very-short-patch-repair endonuclease